MSLPYRLHVLIYGLTTCLLLTLPLSLKSFNLSLAFTGSKGTVSTSLIDPPYQIKTIVIDAGHGGKDPGCSGKHSREKHIALAIAKKLAQNIQAAHPAVNVILTRDEDVFIPLHERAAIANRNNADLFISIHCNYMPGSTATRGSETYVMGLHTAEHNLNVAKRENDAILLESNYEKNYDYDPNSPEGHILLSIYQNAFLEQSIRFAQLVEENYHVYADRKSRGVKQAGFVVLKETTMPSVLIETGFLSSPTEEDWLQSEEGQEMAAGALLHAFSSYKLEMEEGIVTQAIKEDVLPTDEPVPSEPIAALATATPATATRHNVAPPPVQSTAVPSEAQRPAMAPVRREPRVVDDASIGGSPYPLRTQSAPVVATRVSETTPHAIETAAEQAPPPSAHRAVQRPIEAAATDQPRVIITRSRPVAATPHPSSQAATVPTNRPPVARATVPVMTEKTVQENTAASTQPVARPDAAASSLPVSTLSGQTFFYLQLAASGRLLDTGRGKWLNLPYPVVIVQENGMYKYQIRQLSDYAAVEAARRQLADSGFADAWIVTYRDGERIDTQQALEELGY